MKFEVWQGDGSYGLISFPSINRWIEMRERRARLRLRFEAPNWRTAKQVFERFAFGGNPNRFVPLNEPAKRFFLPIYPCGFAAGDRVIFRKKYNLRSDGRVYGEFPPGLEAKVLKGDVDMPEIVWLRLLRQEKPFGNDMSMSQEDACEFLEHKKSTSRAKSGRKNYRFELQATRRKVRSRSK